MSLTLKLKASLAITALSLFITSAPAAATTFTFEAERFSNRRSLAGTHKALSTSFDDETNLLKWSSTFSRNTTTHKLAEGGWLVLSDGPKPADLENAIFYLDGINNKVSAYAYDANRRRSWQSSELLGQTALNVTNDGDDRTFDFMFDMTQINAKNISPNWEGGRFGNEIGLWFQAVADLDIAYKNGEISRFRHGVQSGYDKKNLDTVVLDDNDNNAEAVPEPATAAAMGVFAAAAAFAKRRQRSA